MSDWNQFADDVNYLRKLDQMEDWELELDDCWEFDGFL